MDYRKERGKNKKDFKTRSVGNNKGEKLEKTLHQNYDIRNGLRGKIQNVVSGGGVFSRGDGKKQKRRPDLKGRGEKWRKSR